MVQPCAFKGMPMSALQQYQIWIGLGFVAAVVLFLMVAFFFSRKLTEDQRIILQVLSALCAGFAAALITGDALFKLSGKTSAFEYTVSGASGCALFFVVWFFFPKPKNPAPADDRFNLSIPEQWTFQHAVDAIVRSDQAVADYSVFTDEERNCRLKAWEISTATVSEALMRLRNITFESGAIRGYRVSHDISGGVYTFILLNPDPKA
jgi:hypothetical protein